MPRCPRIALWFVVLWMVALAFVGLSQDAAPLLMVVDAGGPVDPGTPEFAWYEFENGAFTTDSSGNGRTLTNSGATQPNDATRGYVAHFDGINDSMYRSAMDLDGLSAWTMAAWISADTTQSSATPRVFGSGQYAKGGVILGLLASNAAWGYWIFNDNSAVSSYETANGGATLLGQGWLHVAITFESGTATTYFNGTFIQSRAATYYDNTLNIFTLGNNSQLQAGKWYGGLIDDLRVYSRALTQDEITWLSEH